MIVLTQGDTALLELTATDGDGLPIDITGSVFTTYIREDGGNTASFSNGQHTIVDAVNGMFSLQLSSADTQLCGLGRNKDILTKIVQGASTIYYRGVSILTINPPVPVQ